MAIEKKTVVDQIEITRNGTLQVRLAKCIVEDGTEISKQYHRTAIPPGVDVDAQMVAVNADLVEMNEAQADAAEIQRVKDIAAVEHTAQRIQAYQDALAAQQS